MDLNPGLIRAGFHRPLNSESRIIDVVLEHLWALPCFNEACNVSQHANMSIVILIAYIARCTFMIVCKRFHDSICSVIIPASQGLPGGICEDHAPAGAGDDDHAARSS